MSRQNECRRAQRVRSAERSSERVSARVELQRAAALYEADRSDDAPVQALRAPKQTPLTLTAK